MDGIWTTDWVDSLEFEGKHSSLKYTVWYPTMIIYLSAIVRIFFVKNSLELILEIFIINQLSPTIYLKWTQMVEQYWYFDILLYKYYLSLFFGQFSWWSKY